MSPFVSVIVLTWNTREMTAACVRQVHENTAGPYELILVDNGSTDGTEDALNVTIRHERNLGFAAGCNSGILAATGDFICLLNSDALVTAGWISPMVEMLATRHDLGLVVPRTDARVCGLGQRGEPGQTYPDQITQYPVPFFCVVIPRAVIDQVGLLDERFFANYEDDDYCRRLTLAGYRIAICGRSFVHHATHKTFEMNGVDYLAGLDDSRRRFREKWGLPGYP